MSGDYRLDVCPACDTNTAVATAPPYVCRACDHIDTQPAHRDTPTDIALTRAARMERM